MLFTVFPAITRTLSTCTADFDLTSCVSSCCTWRRGGMHREWLRCTSSQDCHLSLAILNLKSTWLQAERKTSAIV